MVQIGRANGSMIDGGNKRSRDIFLAKVNLLLWRDSGGKLRLTDDLLMFLEINLRKKNKIN